MRLAIWVSVIATFIGTIALTPTTAGAQVRSHSCGKIGGVPVHAHGVTCRAARRVYKADMRGEVPRGWTCSASLARCYKGGFESGRFMWWKQTMYRPAESASSPAGPQPGMIGAGASVSEVGEGGSRGVSASWSITPVSLPRSHPAPVTVEMGFASPPLEGAIPEIDRIEFDIARHVTFQTAGVPSCSLARLYSASRDPRESCPGSLVGHGRVSSEITVAGHPPARVSGRLLAFYALARGRPRILAQVTTGEPLPLVYVIPFTIGKTDGQFGTSLVAPRMAHLQGICAWGHPNCFSNPYALEGVYGHISDFEMSLHRVARRRRKRISFVSATCPLPANVAVGGFLQLEAKLDFSSGASVSIPVERNCKARAGS